MSRGQLWGARLALLLLTLLAWRGALSTYFGADDVVLLDGLASHAAWVGPWRILDRVWLLLEWSLFGAHPLPYHLVQLSLHALNVQLLLALLLTIEVTLSPAVLGAAVFAVHPLSFGCVYPPSGLGTLAGFSALLGATLVWARYGARARGIWLASLLGVLAVGFKETYAPGIVALAFLPGRPLRAAGGSRNRRAWLIPATVTLATGAVLLLAALGGPLAGQAYALHPGMWLKAAGTYMNWLLAPSSPVPDVIADTRLPLRALPIAIGIGLSLLLGGMALAAPGKGRTAASAALTWLAGLSLPALLTPQHLYLYYLYGSLAGFAVLGAGALEALSAKLPPAARPLLAGACLALAAVTCVQGEAAVRARGSWVPPEVGVPADPFMRQQQMVRSFVQGMRAAGFSERQRVVLYHSKVAAGAMPEDSRLGENNALTAATDSGRALETLGRLHLSLRFEQRFHAADTADQSALYFGDGAVQILGQGPGRLNQMATLWAGLEDWGRVEPLLESYLSLAPRDTVAWFNLMVAQSRLGRVGPARASARRLLELQPSGPQADWARKVVAGTIPRPPSSGPP